MMSTNIEIEAKILVDELEFNQLKKFLNVENIEPILQTNYYIDDEKASLRSFGFALRIRQIKHSYTLTLKSPMAEGTLEKNQALSSEDYEHFKKTNTFPQGILKDFLEMFGFQTETLKIITSLTTERIDTKYQGQAVCLDKNIYGKVMDFEIESEQSSLAYAADTLKKLCLDAGIPYKENKISKYARALRAIKN